MKVDTLSTNVGTQSINFHPRKSNFNKSYAKTMGSSETFGGHGSGVWLLWVFWLVGLLEALAQLVC